MPAPDVKLAILYAQLDAAKDVATKQHVMNSIKEALKVSALLIADMDYVFRYTVLKRDTFI